MFSHKKKKRGKRSADPRMSPDLSSYERGITGMNFRILRNLRSCVFFFFGKKGKKYPPSPRLNIREGGYDRRLHFAPLENFKSSDAPTHEQNFVP